MERGLVTDDNVPGKALGHVLLAIVRFVCGAFLGFLAFLLVASYVFRFARDSAFFHPLVLGGFVVACGVLAVIFGDRFLEWIVSLWKKLPW